MQGNVTGVVLTKPYLTKNAMSGVSVNAYVSYYSITNLISYNLASTCSCKCFLTCKTHTETKYGLTNHITEYLLALLMHTH